MIWLIMIVSSMLIFIGMCILAEVVEYLANRLMDAAIKKIGLPDDSETKRLSNTGNRR